MSQHPISISTGNFNLQISGVAGFFGGDEAVQAMKTIHLYRARRWTGWYNAPGSFAVAKCLGPIANSRFWNGLFPGPNQEPEAVFGLDNQAGPKYIASQSGTIIDKTTHVAYLVTQQSKDEHRSIRDVKGRVTKPMTIATFEVTGPWPSTKTGVKPDSTPVVAVNVRDHNKWWASVPILISFAACALCAYNSDWYCLVMVLLGIISNGLTCIIVGSASVILDGVKPVNGAPPGDGILMDDSSNHVVILRGEEENVNWITKGRFRLEYLPHVWMKKKRYPSSSVISNGKNGDEEKALGQESIKPKEHRSIGICGLLLGIQSLLQLLLIPQGTLPGQISFLSSFVISWVYNLYLSSLDKEKVQRELLSQTLGYRRHPYDFMLGTRTSAAVFAALVLRPPSNVPRSTREKVSIKLLERFVPNDTPAWEKCRKHVGEQITAIDWNQNTDWSEVGRCQESLRKCGSCAEGLSEEDNLLLKKLLEDACDAFVGYYTFLTTEDESDNQNGGGDENSSSVGHPLLAPAGAAVPI